MDKFVERVRYYLSIPVKYYQTMGRTILFGLAAITLISLVNCGCAAFLNKKQAHVTIQQECRQQAKDFLSQANSYLTSGTVINLSTFPIRLNCPDVYEMLKVTEELVNKKVTAEFNYELKRKLMQEELDQRKALEAKLAADLTKAVSVLQKLPIGK